MARLEATNDILKSVKSSEEPFDCLDIGCGDGFFGRKLFVGLPLKTYTGIDTNLSAARAADMSIEERGILYVNEYRDLGNNRYSLTLMMDVLEHVECDRQFLADIVYRYGIKGGYILITVPAFPFLFSGHDRFLKHYRRYSGSELLHLIESARLSCVSHGYLFVSLLLVRWVSMIHEILFPSNTERNMGVGNWNHGEFVTNAIVRILRADNWLSSTLNRIGIKLPGLTIWALCKKP
jgi:SAM-dependent methyltransferase